MTVQFMNFTVYMPSTRFSAFLWGLMGIAIFSALLYKIICDESNYFYRVEFRSNGSQCINLEPNSNGTQIWDSVRDKCWDIKFKVLSYLWKVTISRLAWELFYLVISFSLLFLIFEKWFTFPPPPLSFLFIEFRENKFLIKTTKRIICMLNSFT